MCPTYSALQDPAEILLPFSILDVSPEESLAIMYIRTGVRSLGPRVFFHGTGHVETGTDSDSERGEWRG
jgi:hypothetical protein